MNKKSFFFSAFTFAFLFILSISTVNAETRIDNGYINQDTVWDKSGSPYIIANSVIVDRGHTLTINHGAQIMTDPSISTNYAPYFSVNDAKLIINGNASDRVSFKGIDGIEINRSQADIKYADIDGGSGLNIAYSYTDIASSTVVNTTGGININKSAVSVRASVIKDNIAGIKIQNPNGGIFLMYGRSEPLNSGGIGNALDILPTPTSTSLTISGSSLVNNTYSALDNLSIDTVARAANNWWGTASGPSTVGINRISGSIQYDPWLVEDPFAIKCCSSVLFIPGMEGSRLYRDEKGPLGFLLGTSANTLWEPNRNDDVRKLFLNANGSSSDPTVYSGDVMGKAYGLFDIYSKFTDFLDNLVKQKTMNRWQSFAYDWRKPIAEVVAGPEKKATTTEYLIQEMEKLASNSKTGKVTLIAHSNGGLVAKYLVKILADIGKADLIDSIISVAVPYLGTPQAIASILHGDGQSIAGGLFLSQSVARQFGDNMASAYSLLPSAAYFSKIFEPTIAFASTTVLGVNNGSYPMNIQSSANQSAFIADTVNTRPNPALSNIDSPIKGNQLLMAAADALHGIIDPFSWPATIAKWAILGWNSDTVKRVNYSASGHNISNTIMGDGTVVAKSAAYDDGLVASADLKKISDNENSNISHARILESAAVQNAIEGIIKHDPKSGLFPLRDGMTWGEPDYSKDIPREELVVSTHSPVELHVYDEKGNHTGFIPVPPELDIEEGLVTMVETKIPGSGFNNYPKSDNDSNTFIRLPYDGRKYTVAVKGVGVGTFDLQIQRDKGDQVLSNAEYDNIPVTPLTVATTTIQIVPISSDATSSPDIVSSTAPLIIDIDGNGVPDIQATSTSSHSDKFDAITYLESLKKTIIVLLESSNKAKNLNKRIDRLEELFNKGKLKQTYNFADKLAKRLGHKKLKELSDADRQLIVDMIDAFVAQFE